MSIFRRAPWLLEALAKLPLDDDRLATVIRAAADPLPDDVELLRRANRRARVLENLHRPELPAGLADPSFVEHIVSSVCEQVEGRVLEGGVAGLLSAALTPVSAPAALRSRDLLEQVFEDAATGSAERLRSTAGGDALAEGLAPLQAPGDVDWAEAALEDLERLGAGPVSDPSKPALVLGDPGRTPGWLWARIRGDVRQRVVGLRRRRSAWRVTMLAAAVVLSGLLWLRLQADRVEGSDPTIVFQRVDAPLSDQFSTTAVVRRVRDGR